MGMPAQNERKPRVCRLPVDFRGMGQENRECAPRDFGCGLFDVVHPEEMRVVDPRQINTLVAARDPRALVEQHPDPDVLEPRHHANRIVIAEDAVDRSFDVRTYLRQPLESTIEWTSGCSAIVSSQDADIVA